ncbi:extradiol dioxygenase, partial [Flavobacterium circumlabens]
MAKQIWLNLPVKNVAKAKDFFWKIGFSFNEQHDTPTSTCMLVGEGNFVVMLFED